MGLNELMTLVGCLSIAAVLWDFVCWVLEMEHSFGQSKRDEECLVRLENSCG